MLTTRTLETPIGELRLVGSDAGLRLVLWPGRDAGDGVVAEPSPLLDEAARQLAEYVAGARTAFDVPLDLRGTPFQLRAWRALAAIPYGETVSYAEQARRLGRPHAVRAVGAANGRNPVPIVLPCHRIVGSDGSLTGFGGGLDVKRALLDHEAGLRPLL
jgi:methylated-DNA-[protein]-cysteine S-methyltransferase